MSDPRGRNPVRVVIVDDDALVRAALSMILRDDDGDRDRRRGR